MYFSHDTDARNEEKILGVRMELGAEGYGMYWMLLEKLAAEKTHVLTLDMAKLSWDMRCDANKLKKLICDFGLFAIDEEQMLFWSEGLMARMEKADAVSSVRSEAGKASAEARRRKANTLNSSTDESSSVTNAQQTVNKCSKNGEQNADLLEQKSNKTNKIKGKEIKENKIKEKLSSSKPSLAEASAEDDEAAGAAEEEDNGNVYEEDLWELWTKAYSAMKEVRMPAASSHEDWEKICRMLSTPKDEDRKKLVDLLNALARDGKNGADLVTFLKLADRKKPINAIDERTWSAINAIDSLSSRDVGLIKAAVGRRKAAWHDLILAVEEWQRSKKIVQPGRFILSKLKAS